MSDPKDDPRSTARGFAMPSVSEALETQREGIAPVEGAEGPPTGQRPFPAVPLGAAPAPPPAATEVKVAHGQGPLVQEKSEKGVARRPAVEIELVSERRMGPVLEKGWVALQVWTQNRIYALDSAMRCVEVVDQATGKADPKHAMLGARLVGGQHREADEMELSHPFPRPGSEAVFESGSGQRSSFSQTSPVTRVVLRLRVVTVARDNLVPAWEDISGSFAFKKS